PSDLISLVAAAGDADRYRRQVAANLLREADPAIAATEWSRLVADPAGAVRRAAVDAMVDAGREELRPLLESALGDPDAWVRWKALRGLVELGPEPSREAVAVCAGDADFRVRLEAAGALRALAGS
ncbi:MAG: HEAT repeat domain-containing protein, partial [Actinomycetota bacterium]|nr:HEAT repeat domain-containing protein [Actinomycetota bacterium]